MSRHTAADVVRSYCDAWFRGDTAAVLGWYHVDLSLDWPGRHRLAGVHDGQGAAIDALVALQAITNRSPVEIIDVLVGDHSVMALVRERWTADPGNADAHAIEPVRALNFTVEDGLLRTCRVLEADQLAVDDWIDRYGADVSGG